MSSSPKRGVFLSTGIVLALIIVASVTVFLGISRQIAARNVEVRGQAADYDQLASTPVIGERIGYFPRAARNIEYWCRPFWTGINGSFDIGEDNFLDWAHTMGWHPRQLQPTELGPTIELMHVDSSREYIEVPKACLFYAHQTFDQSGNFSRDYQVIYDRARKRASFTDSGHFAGPPSGGEK